MRYSRHYIVFTILLLVFVIGKFRFTGTSYAQVSAFRGAQLLAEDWNPLIADTANQGSLTVTVDGHAFHNSLDGIYMDEQLRIMMPVSLVRDAFRCSTHVYDEEELLVEKREDSIRFALGKDNYLYNQDIKDEKQPLVRKGNELYVALKPLAETLGYTYTWDMDKTTVTAQDTTEASTILPHRYDMREKGRAPVVKNQGESSTCWAFAALTALESSAMPEEKLEFAVDHMNKQNSFQAATKDGGQYTMAMAYLAAWQGPVYEADDPYGDGETDASLTAVRHVQDMQIIEAKDLEHIKEAVFLYGGVESCIYTSMQSSESSSYCYDPNNYAYCYLGEDRPNHDVVIIGWDDSYPKENFPMNVEGDGAFICQNSWGQWFGDEGVFYVSYYDSNIGSHNLVYTGMESVDNYKTIYQSDLCGWVGQMGYNKESVYGANVFTAKKSEDISAVGFYTTGKDTAYEVSVVPEFTDKESLDSRILLEEGTFTYAGYHTVTLNQPMTVKEGQKFAIVIRLSTPNAKRPLAIEYAADALTQNVDLSDGEGYVSAQGSSWSSAEEESRCNLCIKAYGK